MITKIDLYESKRSCCSKSAAKSFIRLIHWLPVLFILGVMSWSYYAYVYQLCFVALESNVQRGFYLFFFHLAFLLMLWSFFNCVTARIPIPTPDFYLSSADVQQFTALVREEDMINFLNVRAANLPVQSRSPNGCIRYCPICMCIKPDRSHHCSVCNMCVLKMDHHCPWINNCVSFSNYKYFILFLVYTTLTCVFIFCTSFEYFVKFWSGSKFSDLTRFTIIFLLLVATVFGLSVFSFLGFHLWLLALNRTTLENYRSPAFAIGPVKNAYHHGTKANFREVFGNSILLAFIPVFTSIGDGRTFQPNILSEVVVHNTDS